jgi:hypothetical protein
MRPTRTFEGSDAGSVETSPGQDQPGRSTDKARAVPSIGTARGTIDERNGGFHARTAVARAANRPSNVSDEPGPPLPTARSARRNPDPAPDPPGLHRRPRGRERSGSRTRTTGDLPRAPRAGCTTSYRRRPRHRGDRRPIQGSGTPSPGAAIPTLALHACALTTSARAGCDSNQPSSGRSGQSPGRARSSATRGPFGRTPRSAHAVSFGCLIQIDRR